MEPSAWLAIPIVMSAIVASARGWDVRLTLFAAALLLGGLAGDVAPVIRVFLETFSSEKFVVPICSAMGFAFVLKLTRADQQLVRLLIGPIRSARFFLVPWIVLVGFVVNIPIISQTSTAVCIGTVVVPLMRAAGFSPLAIGSSILLGASIGGELFNPGAPELLTVAAKTGASTVELSRTELPRLVLPLLGIAAVAFWIRTLLGEKRTSVEATPVETGGEGVNVFKAFVPLVPLVLLLLTGPPFNAFHVPKEWLVEKDEKLYSTRLIGLAMLIGVGIAAAASPKDARNCMKSFFDGAGYGFTHVVSLIVVANCFGKAIENVGLAAGLGRLIEANPRMLTPLAALVPWLFAMVCGSGMASTQSLYGFFHAPADALGADVNAVGAMVSVGAAVGRTMSPVAAVTLMCASLTGTQPLQLVRRVALPLLLGLSGVVALRMLGRV
jgi:DcuC family C4-dicarboxylate transporter